MKISAQRFLVYVAGLFITALGVPFSVLCDFGVTPVNAVPYALSLITPLDIGTWTTLFFLFLILLQVLILRREFKLWNLLQILCSTAFGYFVNLTSWLLSPLPADGYWLRALYLAVSIVLTAFGLMLYLTPNVMCLPIEGFLTVVSEKQHMKFSTAKVVFDCVVTVIAAGICFLSFGELRAVGLGTLFAAVAVGKLLGFFTERIGMPLRSKL